MIIHIDTQLKTVFGLHDDEAKAKGITTDARRRHAVPRYCDRRMARSVLRGRCPYMDMILACIQYMLFAPHPSGVGRSVL